MQSWLVPPYTHSTLPLACAERQDGPWKMTVDYSKLNQIVTSNATVVPDVALLFEQTTMSPGIWNAVIDLAYVFFSIPVKKSTKSR